MPFGQSITTLRQGSGTAGGVLFPTGGGGGGSFGGDNLSRLLDMVGMAGGAILAHNAPTQRGIINVNTAPSLPSGSTGTGAMLPSSSGSAMTRSMGQHVNGLYHTTPCGNAAANQVVFENGPNGELFAGMVKRISLAKLKRSLMAQVRSTGARRHSHRHTHRRRRPRRR